MIAENAQDAISNADLRYNPVPTASDTVEEGRVIKYSPSGKQPKGTTIWIYISTGPASSGDSSSE